MKLSAEQIERLYQFTRQHYVEYYDLQTELVDHLANAIEEQWQQNPKLSFENALQIEFKKFGVFGFMDVVEQRQSALNKKYNKLVLNELKTFFQFQKSSEQFLPLE
jgi:SPX domain protein involved in polyphosphate accumulation